LCHFCAGLFLALRPNTNPTSHQFALSHVSRLALGIWPVPIIDAQIRLRCKPVHSENPAVTNPSISIWKLKICSGLLVLAIADAPYLFCRFVNPLVNFYDFPNPLLPIAMDKIQDLHLRPVKIISNVSHLLIQPR
jgi:hypothetical protein